MSTSNLTSNVIKISLDFSSRLSFVQQSSLSLFSTNKCHLKYLPSHSAVYPTPLISRSTETPLTIPSMTLLILQGRYQWQHMVVWLQWNKTWLVTMQWHTTYQDANKTTYVIDIKVSKVMLFNDMIAADSSWMRRKLKALKMAVDWLPVSITCNNTSGRQISHLALTGFNAAYLEVATN
jgi:hypothetical protein